MYIPFCPLPVNKAKKFLGNKLYSLAEPLAKIFPNLELELKQADFDLNVRDYFEHTRIVFGRIYWERHL